MKKIINFAARPQEEMPEYLKKIWRILFPVLTLAVSITIINRPETLDGIFLNSEVWIIAFKIYAALYLLEVFTPFKWVLIPESGPISNEALNLQEISRPLNKITLLAIIIAFGIVFMTLVFAIYKDSMSWNEKIIPSLVYTGGWLSITVKSLFIIIPERVVADK